MFGVDYEDLGPMCQQSRGANESISYSYISGAFGCVSDSGSLICLKSHHTQGPNLADLVTFLFHFLLLLLQGGKCKRCVIPAQGCQSNKTLGLKAC